MFFFLIGAYHFSLLIFGKINLAKATPVFIGILWALIFAYQGSMVVKKEVRIQTPLLRPERPLKFKGYGTWKEPVADWSKYDLEMYSEKSILYLTSFVLLHKISEEILPEDAVILSRKPSITGILAN